MIFKVNLILAGVLLLIGCSEDRVEIAKTARPGEANEIYVALDRHGIPDAQLVEDEGTRESTIRIKVAPAQVAQARQILAYLNLPRPVGASEEGGGSFARRSPDEIWNRLRQGREIQVSEALRTAGFHEAKVVVGAHNPRDPYAPVLRGSELDVDDKAARALASLVWIKEGGESSCPLAEADIRSLVANAFPGLQAEKVRVVVRTLEIPAMTPVPAERVEAAVAPKLIFVATTLVGLLCVALAVGYVRQRSRLLRALHPETLSRSAEATMTRAA